MALLVLVFGAPSGRSLKEERIIITWPLNPAAPPSPQVNQSPKMSSIATKVCRRVEALANKHRTDGTYQVKSCSCCCESSRWAHLSRTAENSHSFSNFYSSLHSTNALSSFKLACDRKVLCSTKCPRHHGCHHQHRHHRPPPPNPNTFLADYL